MARKGSSIKIHSVYSMGRLENKTWGYMFLSWDILSMWRLRWKFGVESSLNDNYRGENIANEISFLVYVDLSL